MRHTVRPAGPWEYFCRKVRLGGPDDCWEWKASVGTNGYGNWGYGKPGTAHRATYKLFNGEIPEGLWVLHRCNNRKCCNPSHLYAGTPTNNHADRIKDGTDSPPPNFYGKDVRNGYKNSNLSEDDIRLIRRLRAEGVPGTEIGKRFGLSKAVVCAIHKRRNYAWVR